ncbi:MAG: hypothetical protein JNK02_05035 [Planctomycetes bacterium]|nr:hypothetical protein [Planctomycetota bacterium]
MVDGSAPLCFTCGLPSANTLQFNRLPNGQVCPACRDRLLDGIPAALPSPRAIPEMGAGSSVEEESRHQADADGGQRPWPPPGLAS